MILSAKYRWNAWASLLLTVAFLALGFCPLRNVLARLAQPEPARKAQPAPDYAKITSGKESVTFILVNKIAAQPALSPGLVYHFAAAGGAVAFSTPLAVARPYLFTVPLYLRNRALLI